MTQEKKRIIRMLIVDDDPDIRVALQDFFELQGLAVTMAADGQEAMSLIRNDPPFDIILLDIMLPRRSGFEVLKEARRHDVQSPVIVLSARSDADMVVKGFDLGAVEYITKPFDAEELAARVRAVLSRTMPPSEAPMDVYQLGSVKINLSTHEVRKNGEPIPFSAPEFGILQFLIRNRGQALSPQDIEQGLREFDVSVSAAEVRSQVDSLRSKIEPDMAAPRYIREVEGERYCFNAQ